MDEAPAPTWQCHPIWWDKRNTRTYILRTVSLDREREKINKKSKDANGLFEGGHRRYRLDEIDVVSPIGAWPCRTTFDRPINHSSISTLQVGSFQLTLTTPYNLIHACLGGMIKSQLDLLLTVSSFFIPVKICAVCWHGKDEETM